MTCCWPVVGTAGGEVVVEVGRVARESVEGSAEPVDRKRYRWTGASLAAGC